MKKLEKKVHFTAEGTSVGCYDSKGNPMRYLLIEGKPYIEIDKSVDRVLDIETAAVHDSAPAYYKSNRSGLVTFVRVKGVVNRRFISEGCSHYEYAERACSYNELASFYLAMYKAHKNAYTLEVKNG